MTEKMQTDGVLSRQAVFVRCCPNLRVQGRMFLPRGGQEGARSPS